MKLSRQRLLLCLAIASTICVVVIGFIVVPHLRDLWAFRQEMAALPDISPFDAHWLELNPDYVGRLRIAGTSVDFPVVRGSDNEKYLTTTFFGEENRLGAIFMDYRNVGDDLPHIIIYGHEAQDETGNRLLFGALHYFVDEAHLAAHPTISFMANNTLYEFDIFSARQSDIHDPAYQLHFPTEDSFADFLERNGAPPDATRIITLSTCIGVDNDYRMIVQGALARAVPVQTYYGETGWQIVLPE